MSTFVLISFTALGLAALYFLVASGLSLIFGLMHVLNLAHGALLAVGGMAGLWLMKNLTAVPLTARFVLTCVAVLVLGLVLGAFLEKVIVGRLYGEEFSQLLLTLGIGLVITAALGGWFGFDPRPMTVPKWFNNTVDVLGANIVVSRFVVIAFAIVALAGILFFLSNTRHGLIIRAGVENRTMVRALGIRVDRSFTLVFSVASALVMLAGLLSAVFYSSASPELGSDMLIFGFVVVIIGGLGSVVGTAYASLIVAFVQQFGDYYGDSGIGELAVVALLVVVLLARPNGLMGRVASA